jgi:hypothetical protein
MTDAQKTLQEQVMARAMKDEVFRQELLNNPNKALERELGITLPKGVNVQVHEDTPTTVHLVLPLQSHYAPVELSDAELEQVAGGIDIVDSYGICKGPGPVVPVSGRVFNPDGSQKTCSQ